MGSCDVARAMKFYETLGLTLIVESLPKYVRFVCPNGDATISIHKVEEFRPGSTVVYFECEDLEDQVEKLVKEGVIFEQHPMDQSWLWREAILKDPDGNQIILYCAGKNRVNPAWKIN